MIRQIIQKNSKKPLNTPIEGVLFYEIILYEHLSSRIFEIKLFFCILSSLSREFCHILVSLHDIIRHSKTWYHLGSSVASTL